ncbi:MAG: hypothetical protein GWN30_11160, partial [Gammaproteobacteria bacterium]|nr:hypothetical protein [Gammaproteobacteria bacterium]
MTAKPGEIGEENTLMFIQEPSGGPWSGIPVSSLDGYPHAGLDEGVLVQAVGMVTETQYGDSSVTQLILSPEDGALSVLDRGEGIQPAILQTGDLPETDPMVSEHWESVLVKFVEPEIVNVDVGDGDWLVDDGSGTV